MPFFNHSMAQSMRRTSKSISKVSKYVQIRSMPGVTENGKATVARSADPSITSKYTQKMSTRKLLFTRSLLKSQIEQLNNQTGALPVNQNQTLFDAYQIDYSNKLMEYPQVQVYPAKNRLSPEFSMVVNIYSIGNMDPNSFYLKILRHLGRKHPFIVISWEIFYNDCNVFIFQEFVSKGNLVEYLQDNQIDEKQLCFWAKQIYRALDFLGDNGIAHRDIAPNNLFVKPMANSEIWIKLTGFQRSVIYWNTEENDVNFCPCVPIEQQKTDGPNFQAPEVYGQNGEFFDPILADIWSFGANLFYSLTKYYPYNIQYPNEELDDEILHNIQAISNISVDCRNFLFGLLRSNANDRIPFDFIDKDIWINKSNMMTTREIVVPSSYVEKIKIKVEETIHYTEKQDPLQKSYQI